MDWIQAFIMVTGLAGQVLVAKRNAHGFLFWIAGNGALIYNFIKAGQWGLAALYGLYTGISVYSIRSWRRQAVKKSNEVSHLATFSAERMAPC